MPGPNDPGGMMQTQGTHTLPHQTHYQRQHMQSHSTLPRGSVIQELSAPIQVHTIYITDNIIPYYCPFT